MQESLCQWCNQKRPTTPFNLRAFDWTRPLNQDTDNYYDLCKQCIAKARKNRSDELMRVQIANATIKSDNDIKTMQRLMTERTKE